MKIFNYQLLALLALAGTTACSDFLNVKPAGDVDETSLLNRKGIDNIITGMYASMYNPEDIDENYFEAPLTNYQYGDVMGGSANKGSTFTDLPAFTSLETYAITTDNAFLNVKWQSVYGGVFRANNLIYLAGKIKEELEAMPGEAKDYYTETIAHARFFRGFWHFEAVKLFGAAIPYVGSEEYAGSVNPKVPNVDANGNYIYIWDNIINDLQYAFDNLPPAWTANKGLANKWAAAAFLAKVKLYRSSPYNGKNGTTHTVDSWQDVKTLLEKIIASGIDNTGAKYRLADTYGQLYTAGLSDWTGESVFDVQMAISGTQTVTSAINGGPNLAVPGGLGASGWGFFQPSFELVNSHIVDENGLPLLDKAYQNRPPLTSISNGVPRTDLAVYTDPRLDISTGRFNVPYLDYAVPERTDGWVRDVSNGGLYMNKKYIPNKADKGSLSLTTVSTSTAKNVHLIRYADVLLWYAEALIETGDWAGAREYVNRVRARAANAYVKAADPVSMKPVASPFVLDDKVNAAARPDAAANYCIGLYPESQFETKEKAMEALQFERKIEFALEGHRWYDLARWGVAREELTDYLNYEKQYLTKYNYSVYNAKWMTMPVPNDQIITMGGVLVQNENWK
ncbi:MAG: RagB/SusD family nutrient uptake outer membrane protein [Dysgonamonadaceae bacterium]|jgi:hypothetical protein|nr:RagB/SusD family nutrient uptake outer membrane protein [Dysgonamonadaceae bacterium]